jgi:hypothetical protein
VGLLLKPLGFLIRPLGYLAFGAALLLLWVAARVLGEKHELGFFAGRLHGMVSQFPEVSRWETPAGWFMWALLFALAVSPLDPIASRWDEVVLLVIALLVCLRRIAVARQAEH